MVFVKGRLLTKILLLFGVLIVFFTVNGMYSIWQWQRIQKQELAHALQEKLTLADTILLNQQDKFEHISLIVREQTPKFLNMLEYDQIQGLNLQLRNLAQVYDIDLLLLFDDRKLLATSNNNLSGEMPEFVYNAVPFHFEANGVFLDSLPAYLFQSETPGEVYLCFQAVLTLYYDAGDVAGHLVMMKALNHDTYLTERIARLVSAEVAIFTSDGSPVVSSIPLPYSNDKQIEYAGHTYYLLHKSLKGFGDKPVAELVIAVDGAAFQAQWRLWLLSNLVPFAVILSVSILLFLLLRWRIFDKLSELILTLQAIKSGYLDVRLKVPEDLTGADELTEMAANFNTMMDRLATSYHEVEHSRRRLEGLNQKLRAEVTERKNIAAALREAKHEAEIANRAKSVFLANMSHEIRTPMNAILGYAHLLLRDRDINQTHQKALNTIARSGNHLLDLINDILDISKIEAGHMAFKAGSFDLRELLHDLAAMFQLRCEEKHLDWQLNMPAIANMTVYGDERKLRQVLINLLGNAVKFTNHGSVSLIVLAEAPKNYIFEVKDSGPGIDKAAQERIFDAFYQDTSGEDKGGTGLGLAISYHQVELMGGKLGVESELGAGTRFGFSLPLPASTVPLKQHTYASAEIRRLDGKYQVSALVVDDIEENRDVLSQLLRSIGVQVRAAPSAEEGLHMLGQEIADIVFMDYRLPGMDGIQATYEICQRFDKRIKVVMVSASTFPVDYEKFHAAGCSAFIGKPYQPAQIFECMGELLNVQYEYDQAPSLPASSSSAEADWHELVIPAHLHERLKEAAEFGIVTTLDATLAEISALGGDAVTFAVQVKKLAEGYNMDKILAWLDTVKIA